MKAVKALAKTFIIGAGFVSLIAVAETYYDQKFYTASFIDQVQEVNFKLPSKAENRIVASKEKKLPIVQEVTLDNASLIDGDWKITKVINDLGDVTYDSEKDFSKDAVVVEMKLISISTVRIDNDLEQTFKVSYLTENGTIALFKEFGEGYEIVQAIRYNKPVKKEVKKAVTASEETSQKEVTPGQKFHIDEALTLLSAIDPKKTRSALRGNLVQGNAYLNNGELILEGVAIHLETPQQTEMVSTEVRLKGHGAFNDDNGIAGVVTNVTKNEIKVRFSTGPLAGVMLNFVTDQKKSEIEEKFGASFRENRVEEIYPPAQGQAINAQTEKPEVYPEQVKEEEEIYAEEEQAFYEEADGQRANESQVPQFGDDAQQFEEMREMEESRYPSSVDIKEVGFSF